MNGEQAPRARIRVEGRIIPGERANAEIAIIAISHNDALTMTAPMSPRNAHDMGVVLARRAVLIEAQGAFLEAMAAHGVDGALARDILGTATQRTDETFGREGARR